MSERLVLNMAKTSVLYARIDSELKEKAESILAKLGVSPSAAVQMFYSQVVLRKGIPFEMRLYERPVFMDELTPEELEREIEKGIWSAEHENTYTAEEVDEILKKEFGI